MSNQRKPGRPPLDPNDPSVEVCVALPAKRYDDLYTRARLERVSIQELIRRSLRADQGKKISKL